MICPSSQKSLAVFMSTLTAYAASAGSGKTFRITREYLKLILKNTHAASGYRRILAVTFTNKATEEMKTRIVEELDFLARGNEKKLKDLCREFAAEGVNVSPLELQQRALDARGNILHDYSRFSILTIDKFFQKVLRAFVNDVGLRPGFNLELDTNRLLEEAVEAVLENAEGNEQRQQWLYMLHNQRIEEGHSWRLKKILLDLGREIFSETFQHLYTEVQDKLNDKTFLQDYVQGLQKMAQQVDNEMQDIAQKAKSYMQAQGIQPDDFKGKSKGFIMHFDKLLKKSYTPTKTALDAVNTPDSWIAKGSDVSKVREAYPHLNPLLEKACTLWQEKGKEYSSVEAITKKFMVLGLLADIAHHVRDIASDENLLLISDSTSIISGLIGDSEAPFLYEKLGNTFRTFMIDEFQDTSKGQWNNFLPLIKNSLSEDEMCMVVGDVKQSIYRWRNGDWRILAYQIDDDLRQFGTTNRKALKDNWRSLYNVVVFNNALFKVAAQHLQATLNESNGDAISENLQRRLSSLVVNAYDDCIQHPQRDGEQEGYVRLEFVADSEEQSATAIVLEKLPQLIASLQDKGYKASDIAILTRNNEEGQVVANRLLSYRQASGDTEHCFDVVSQDSLFLNASSVVQLCIALLRLASGQKNDISEAFLRHEMSCYLHGSENVDMHTLFSQKLAEEDWQLLQSLPLKSLPEAFECIVRHYKLNLLQDELPFLQGLHELIVSFANRKISDISAFLEWWDESGVKKALQSPGGQEAIKISTIHKSKGLQYKVVVVPFCSWDIDTKTNSVVWMKPNVEPFSKLPYVPLSYSSKLSNTIFAEQHAEERAQAYVDNLNVLYVALTRAEEQLYIFVPQKTSKERKSVSRISHVLEDIFGVYRDNASIDFEGLSGKKNEAGVIEFGIETKLQSVDKENNTPSIPLRQYPSEVFTPRLRIHYDAQRLLNEGEQGAKAYGTLMHKAFERIRTVDDVNSAVDFLLDEGWVQSDNVEELRQKINSALQQPGVASFFSDEWTVRNEADIILPHHDDATLLRRPDRVMSKNNHAVVLDYKFGKNVEAKHQKQVQEYAGYLSQMGFEKVDAYVWYVTLGELTHVSIYN
jgi:ATP-dependent exoDNAse (exonuclease V) beta subunit